MATFTKQDFERAFDSISMYVYNRHETVDSINQSKEHAANLRAMVTELENRQIFFDGGRVYSSNKLADALKALDREGYDALLYTVGHWYSTSDKKRASARAFVNRLKDARWRVSAERAQHVEIVLGDAEVPRTEIADELDAPKYVAADEVMSRYFGDTIPGEPPRVAVVVWAIADMALLAKTHRDNAEEAAVDALESEFDKLLDEYAELTANHASLKVDPKNPPRPAGVYPPKEHEGVQHHWLKSERSSTASVAEWLDGNWFCGGEEKPVTGTELKRRGWEYDKPCLYVETPQEPKCEGPWPPEGTPPQTYHVLDITGTGVRVLGKWCSGTWEFTGGDQKYSPAALAPWAYVKSVDMS